MKILKKDLKKGVVSILIQSQEDCWHLYNIVNKGDYVSTLTFRSKKEREETLRSKKEEKEKIYLQIQVEDQEFQKFTDRLRIRGKIIVGADEVGAYHTFNIKPGMKVTITKIWSQHHLTRLKTAVKSHPKMMIVAMDEEQATLAKIHEYGIEELATIPSYRSGKMYSSCFGPVW